MIALDTNVIVRLLVADDAEQAEKARRLIEGNDLVVATTVLLECEWVLRASYQLKPVAIGSAFEKLVGLPQLRLTEPTVVQDALHAYRLGLDFADALHLAGSREAQQFATFDKSFRQRAKGMLPIEVIEP
jgi:predicted nucleic-acid-binding protein